MMRHLNVNMSVLYVYMLIRIKTPLLMF